MLDRYGVQNAFQLETSKEKSKETCLRKYGAEYFQSTDGFVEKTTETCRERYGADWFLQTDAFRENLKRNNLEKYGVEYSFQRLDVKEKIRKTNMERYGCESPMQNPEINAKAKRRYELVCLMLYGSPCYFTSGEYKAYCMEKFGVEHPMKNPEIRRKTRGKYEFDEAMFDSAPELALYVWLTDMGVDFEYQPAVSFEYGYAGKTHAYFPDFRIGERYIEVKGPQFFGGDGRMLNPYRDPTWSNAEYRAECGKYEAKRICMLENGIELLSEAGYGKYLGYAEKKYGRNFVRKFRREMTT